MSTPRSAERYIRTCPVGCVGALVETKVVLPQGPLLECMECGQLLSQVTEEHYWRTMSAFDAADYNQPSDRALERRRKVAMRRLRKIESLLGKPLQGTRLIDVGCSRGHFVAAAVDAGCDAEGIEPAPHVAAAARASGLRVREGLLEQAQFPEGSFDVVTMFEVIEHLRDPIPLMRECRRILKPAGILCLSTGNARSWTAAAMGARWDYFQIECDAGHISFYNPGSMALLAARTGFGIEALNTSRVSFARKGEVPAPVYAMLKVIAELLNAPSRIAGYGHDMLAYLRRKA